LTFARERSPDDIARGTMKDLELAADLFDPRARDSRVLRTEVENLALPVNLETGEK
jgi:hypothetical protein